jgi:hypothetical protein
MDFEVVLCNFSNIVENIFLGRKPEAEKCD